MVRRIHTSFFLPAVFAWCIAAAGQAAPLQVPRPREGRIAPITLGQSVVPLYGPWRFQAGDSPVDPVTHEPLWAEPAFDDSTWESVDLKPQASIEDPFTLDPRYVQGWTTKGHPGYWGYAWYRLSVPVTSAPGERLALLTYGWVDDGYQLFDNGELLGSWGKFQTGATAPVVYFTQPAMFVLTQPATSGNLSRNPAMVTLAFRVWMGPVKLSHHPFVGGLHYAPVLGAASAVEMQTHLEWLELIRNHASSPIAASVFLLLAIVAGSLVLFDRSDPVYLWVAGPLLLIGINEVFFSLASWTQFVSFRMFFFQNAIGFSLMFGAWGMAWWIWFKLRRPQWIPKAIAALTLLNMISELLGEHLLYGMIPDPVGVIFHGVSLLARLLLLAIIVFIVGKGIREQGWEGWLVLPAVVLLAFAQFQGELISLHWHGTFSAFGIVFFYSEGANLLLSAVVALLLLRRLLLSVRRQRQMTLDVKQAQEVQQVILPEARTTLPGLVIESEYRPAREVGGDFFQIIPHHSDGSLLIAAGDVTGKGLKAGMLVALLVGAIRGTAELNADPEFVLNALNRRLLGRGDAQATCLALRIAKDGAVTLANAGHMAPYLNGEPMAMEGALPLGMIEGAEPSVMHFQLKEDDKLVLMSDGIAEATDAEGHLFGFERVHELLRTAGSAAEVAAAAQRFGQEDDISVISVTRTSVCEPAAV
jgi:Stage II sporulation protein E (SpoIIE)